MIKKILGGVQALIGLAGVYWFLMKPAAEASFPYFTALVFGIGFVTVGISNFLEE